VDFHFWINEERLRHEQQYFVAETAQATSQWIEDNYKCKDFVLWVDTFECHEPFAPPEYYVERFHPGYRGAPMYYPDDGPADKYTKAELRNLRARYAGEAALTSKWVGYILRKLQDVGVYDDSFIVGIGDVYSDEILFVAGLRHDRRSDSLSSQEVRRLYRAIVEILHNAVKYRGTNLEDRPLLDIWGEPGIYQHHLSVYGRVGDLSPRSRAPILRTKYKNRWTYYCDTQV